MPHLYCNNDNCESAADYKVVDGGRPVLFLCESCASAYEDGQEQPSADLGDTDDGHHCCQCCDTDAVMYREAGEGDVEYLCFTHATAFEWGQFRPNASLSEISDEDVAGWDSDPLSGQNCDYCGKVLLPNHGVLHRNLPHHRYCVQKREADHHVLL